MDAKSVMSGLEGLTEYDWRMYHSDSEVRNIARASLALLKEQEAVPPEKFMDGHVQRYKCRKCGKHLLYTSFAKDNYCSKCGQKVKWE